MSRPQDQRESRPVIVATDSADLAGDLAVPESARGIVVFAHGSGSSRLSPRNQFVARELRGARLATLLFDLLTAEEDEVDEVTREYRFDIDLLARRLVGATDWLAEQPEAQELKIGYFGASTGSAAALMAAAERPTLVRAIVSRGGRPDLAAPALPRVIAPTLLIVGGNDEQVLGMNKKAMAQMRAQKELAIVEGATHLFEEPGALEEVARLAREWFARHLR
jgi:pimeloyl-ACP methyl ester carboxylesterase